MRRLGVLLIALAWVPTGCSDPTAGGAALTESEFQVAVFSVFELAVIRAVGSAAGTGSEALPLETTEFVPCSLGGEVEVFTRVEGTRDAADDSAELVYLVELRHSGCVEGAGDSADRVQLDGAPGLEGNFTFTRSPEGAVEASGGIFGGLDVRGADADIDCIYEFSFTASGAEGTVEYRLGGSACGLGVQATVTDEAV